MAEELSKVYEPSITEREAIATWVSGDYFRAAASDGRKKSYTIVIPPPNVTAPLHLGHALNNTLQDILIRWRRMQKYNTLWMPGTDHAGIATQTVVEKRLLSEHGKRRTDFEREEFVAHVQAWKDEYEARIISQLKAMGCSCDWARTRFTMDAVCGRAVRAAFFELFGDGLIYRGKRLVNWDPATQTVLADDEVEHETVQGYFWYLKYPLVEAVEIGGAKVEYVTVATTRPETMLGDTAVAMNPADPRAKYLIGKNVRLPIVGRIIPIIGDEHVVLPNPESEDEKAKFSTGFLKVTPAHDPDDYVIGQRHELAIINVMAPDGTISDRHGWDDAQEPEARQLIGLDRFEAREAIVEWFRQEKLLEDVREYAHEVGHSYRSHVPIEPYLSDQWYIAVKKPIEHLAAKFGSGLIAGTDVPVNSLAGLALKPLLDGRLRFIPERYARTYQSWLENLRDWPISRQLWWGHRIPVWSIRVSQAMYRHNGESDVSVSNRRKQETEKLLSDFLVSCKIKTDNISFLWSKELIDGSFPLYVCVQESENDLALSTLKRHLDQHPTSDINLITSYNEENEDIKKTFGEEVLQKLGSLKQYIQRIELDSDVLDTWFSSALWPFSTLGWPEETGELKTFYPGDVLCTAREIITLWVSRMVMMGQYCAGDIPFGDVFIHAMIQDGQGRKMSKSLGNGIDPLAIITSHGADAMRFTLASMTTQTQDVRMPVQHMKLPDGRVENTSPKFDLGRNFCNKLWNASRFVLSNLDGMKTEVIEKNDMALADRWILSRLARTIDEVTGQLEEFKFSEPLNQLYRFFWNDFCDWYLEWAKARIQDGKQKGIAQQVLAFVLDQTLRLLHPFIPFVTEGIFQKLNEIAPQRGLGELAAANKTDALVAADWPSGLDWAIDEAVEAKIGLLQEAIRAIRDIRSKYNKAPSVLLRVSAKAAGQGAEALNRNRELLGQLAGISTFDVGAHVEKPGRAAVAVISDGIEIYVHDVIDIEAERARLMKQREQAESGKRAVETKLNNADFISKAKPKVVEQARAKLAELAEQLQTVEKHLSELGG